MQNWKFFSELTELSFFLSNLPKGLKKRALATSLLSIVSAIMEVASLSSLIPLLNVISLGTNSNHESSIIPRDLSPTAIAIIFLLILTLSTFTRSYSIARINLLSASVGSFYSSAVYNSALDQDINAFNEKSKNYIIAIASTNINYFIDSFKYLFNIASSMVLALCIITFLLINSYEIAVITLPVISISYLLISHLVKSRLKLYSDNAARSSKLVIDTVTTSFQEIKQIKLDNSISENKEEYAKHDSLYRFSASSVNTFATMPRYIVEAISLTIILVIMYTNSQLSSSPISFASIGVFAVGSLKVIPLFQGIFSNYTGLRGNSTYIQELKRLVELAINKPGQNNINAYLNRIMAPGLDDSDVGLELNKITFSIDNRITYRDLSFKFLKGKFTMIMGPSGCGKSTLLNLICGLEKPESGSVVYNYKMNDYGQISFINQGLILNNSSLLNNVTAGRRFNKARFGEIIRICFRKDMAEYIMQNLSRNALTIGFSGGEIQRCLLARALYRDCRVLILDESFNAIDDNAKREIMERLRPYCQSKRITVILVSHNLSDLAFVDSTIKLSEYKLP